MPHKTFVLSDTATDINDGAASGPLTLWYWDLETTGDLPDQDRIVTVQWQQLDDAFRPVGRFTVLTEWEWGEKQVVQEALSRGVLEPGWDFVPVGNRLGFDITFLMERSERLELHGWSAPEVRRFWFTKPMLDLGTVLVLMNAGRFTGSALSEFAEKESGSVVPVLHRAGKAEAILEYVTREKDETLRLFQELAGLLGTFGERRREAKGRAAKA